MILAGDIGGTKSVLGLFSRQSGPEVPLAEAVFPSRSYPTLEEMIAEFLSHTSPERIEAACFGVAGPVSGVRVSVTNLPWVLDEAALASALQVPRVRLINDLQAVAGAISMLHGKDLKTLNQGRPAAEGPRAVIAPGTGLGEAFLTWDGKGWTSHPSEGGHTDFAPTSEVQIQLLRFLGRSLGHVSWESVCSGIGFPNIYAFLLDSGSFEEPSWLRESLEGARDPIPVIVDAALREDPPCPICREAVDLFVSMLGAEAGNLALKVLATGGVYIGGGIPPKILPFLEGGGFMEAFRSKGRMSGLIGEIPVHVILNPKAALMGAAEEGMRMLP
ncbi:MAG: glucokinase [bacterium]|nr:MAG: glucokinase [bacterium]